MAAKSVEDPLRLLVAVAEHPSFSEAARHLGLTPSAVSQAVRRLEQQVGTPLFARTTRSLALTEAGQALVERVRPALRELDDALADVSDRADRVGGTLRLTVGRVAVPLVITPVLGPLLNRHPALSIEVSVDDAFVDLVRAGFDAGVRLSEAIEPDLVATRLTPPFRFVVVGAPGYLARRGRPVHPRELVDHDAVNFRLASSGGLYAWEFERDGVEEEVRVRGRVVANDASTMLAAAIDGLGLTYLPEPTIASDVARGALEVVLGDWTPSVPGFFLYCPPRSARQAKVRAFVECARRVLAADQPRP